MLSYAKTELEFMWKQQGHGPYCDGCKFCGLAVKKIVKASHLGEAVIEPISPACHDGALASCEISTNPKDVPLQLDGL